MPFSALSVLSFKIGSVHVSYSDYKELAKKPHKLNEISFAYYFQDNCDVFKKVNSYFHLVKERVQVFTNNIQQLLNNQDESKAIKFTVYEILELNTSAFYEQGKGFTLKKEYKLFEVPSLSLKKELEQAMLYFFRNFGTMSCISFLLKFYFWLDFPNQKQKSFETLDKRTKEMIEILKKPNLFNLSLFAEIKEIF